MIKVKAYGTRQTNNAEYLWTKKIDGCDFPLLPTPNVIVLGKYDLMLKEGILNENVFIWRKFSFP